MTHERSIFAGTTDYTGVSLADIVRHCGDWRENTDDTIVQLAQCRVEVAAQPSKFIHASALIDYIDIFCNLFSRYKADLDRLTTEMPLGVTDAHLETVRQLLESARLEEERCLEFKRREIATQLPDESMRPLLDRIYSLSRGMLIDYQDLSNVLRRLRALQWSQVHPSPPNGHLDALELKPNLFGLGLNLNYIIPKLREWCRRNKGVQ